MNFDKYGIYDQYRGQEGWLMHEDYPNVKFDKSSFLKEWIDEHVGTDINVILDVGAHEGGDSLRFSSWYPNATVYAIEASSVNFDVMNKKLGDKRPNLKTFNYAMSSEDGTALFHQVLSHKGQMRMGSIYEYSDLLKSRRNLKVVDPEMVKTITFDTFCHQNNIDSVDVAHIDIEGATYNLVLGMKKVLPKLIFTEQEGGAELFKEKRKGGDANLIKLLQERGYEMILKLPNDYLFKLKNE